VPFTPPVALDPEHLTQIVLDSRVTSADVDAYWNARHTRSVVIEGAKPPLGLSLLEQVGRPCESVRCIVGKVSDRTAKAWGACREVFAVPVEYAPAVPIPPDPVSGDVELDPVELRGRRLRQAVSGQASLISTRIQASGQRWRLIFLTLTYRPGVDWGPLHITSCLKAMAKWAKRRGFKLPYIWVCELGEDRGRLHYHVVLWVPARLMMPKPDKQGWWPHGWTKIERARNQGAAAGYLAKYTTKGSAGLFPAGCRIHGAGGLTMVERARMAWGRAPAWVREHWPSWEDRPRPAVGGGWVSRVTGELLQSPWWFVGITSRGRVLVRPKLATSWVA